MGVRMPGMCTIRVHHSYVFSLPDANATGLKIWELVEGRPFFRSEMEGEHDDERHLAEMVSVMGPPPKAFLERSEKCQKYWDTEGAEELMLLLLSLPSLLHHSGPYQIHSRFPMPTSS